MPFGVLSWRSVYLHPIRFGPDMASRRTCQQIFDEPILSVPVAGLSGDPAELATFLAARMAAWTADSTPN
ncbi:MAG: hypothetical protein KF705_00175 [Phycisphaeraceae bacterium]|nr:hypothetical protein [Phycisphaeraceae bacterium]